MKTSLPRKKTMNTITKLPNMQKTEAKGEIVVPKTPPPAVTPPLSKEAALGLLVRPDAPSMPDPLLLKILSTKRCHGSQGDTNFRLFLIDTLKGMGLKPEIKAEGCIVVSTDEKSDTLFSCHIDTVHNTGESDGTFQKLAYDGVMGHLILQREQVPMPTCLGADDGAGIYIMLKMLAAKVPGSYIFHTGEEKGGIGSRAMLNKHRDWLYNFNRAVAFDRPSDFEVIVTQGGTTCASKEAGDFIVNEFKKYNLGYELSHKGVFTDTKVYIGVIPECFNIGVAYYNQHGKDEYLDVVHLDELVKAAISTPWDSMPTVRKPVEAYTPPRSSGYSQNEFKGFSNGYGNGPKKATKQMPLRMVAVTAVAIIEEMDGYRADDFATLAEEDPSVAASVMMLLFVRLRALETEVETYSTILDLN